MKEILWLGDLSQTHILSLDYIATYVGPDYTVLEIPDSSYDYLVSLGRYMPLYKIPDIKVIGPYADVRINKYKFIGWDFTVDEDFTPDSPILSPFDEPEYEPIYCTNLNEYLEQYMLCEPEDVDDMADMLFALAKINNIKLSEFLWNIERSNNDVSLVENKYFTY